MAGPDTLTKVKDAYWQRFYEDAMSVLRALSALLLRQALPTLIAVALLAPGAAARGDQFEEPGLYASVMLTGHADVGPPHRELQPGLEQCADSGCTSWADSDRTQLVLPPLGEPQEPSRLAGLPGLSPRPVLQPPILFSRD